MWLGRLEADIRNLVLRHASTQCLVSRLALDDRLAEPPLDILKSLRGLDMKVGGHESAQSLGVLGLISVMFDDLLQVHSLHSRGWPLSS
jgi:hypothetical protein